MSKAKRKHIPNQPRRQPLEAQASPELRSLIRTYDVLRRGNWTDKELLDLVSYAVATLEVYRVLHAQMEAEHHPPNEAWRARGAFIEQIKPAHSYSRMNEAHKELGRTARAAFARTASPCHL
jgi:hypothetical protein